MSEITEQNVMYEFYLDTQRGFVYLHKEYLLDSKCQHRTLKTLQITLFTIHEYRPIIIYIVSAKVKITNSATITEQNSPLRKIKA
jgi:hypothetical protein